MNPPTRKKSLFGIRDPKQQILLMIAGIGIALVLILVLFFAIFGGNSSSVDQLVPVAQRQTEILRVAELGNRKAGGPSAQKLAVMTSGVVGTDQKAIINYMAQNGQKIDNKELARSTNSETDTSLESAEQNGRFDEVFTRITIDQLEKYQQALVSAAPSLNQDGQDLVERSTKNVELILADNKNN